MKYFLFLTIIFFSIFSCKQEKKSKDHDEKYEYAQMDRIPFSPETYVVYKTSKNLTIDGIADEKEWQKVPFTNKFVDIEGDKKPKPKYDTKVKMLWNNDYLYIYAELKEPHIWANLTKRDAVIFYDNDFEVFIDPDGNNHGYYEYEVNALNTVWDLLLAKPYRDGGPPISNWNINGLQSAVKIYGTINDPSDIDDKWTVEIAFPMSVLNEFNRGEKASDKVQWRINFSRVEWQTKVTNGKYKKSIDPKTNKPFPENNWVWSPQGVINMHQPETWGYIQFSDQKPDAKNVSFNTIKDEKVKWELMNIYYAQRAYMASTGKWAKKTGKLKNVGLDIESLKYFRSLQTTKSLYEVTAKRKGSKFVWHINNSGKLWRSAN